MALKKGDRAPSFTLVSDEKKEVSLADFRGQPLVLLFFPMAFTGVCTTELCHMRDDIATYNKLNAQVVGISVDSPFVLDKYKSELELNFPLLSDFNTEVSRSYDCLYEEFVLGLRGVSKRSAFVINGQGIIRYAEVLENAGDLPNFTAIEETLGAIK
ncbi:MAG: redoxin domain-containing protein [Bacteroidetes bacterium]|nr:redoxin domain-containing protein [Bacteroidota bacterium]